MAIDTPTATPTTSPPSTKQANLPDGTFESHPFEQTATTTPPTTPPITPHTTHQPPLAPTMTRISTPIDADLHHAVINHLDLTGYTQHRVIAAALLHFIEQSPMTQYHMLERLTQWENDGEIDRTGVIGKIGRHGKRLK